MDTDRLYQPLRKQAVFGFRDARNSATIGNGDNSPAAWDVGQKFPPSVMQRVMYLT
jgi:hypothetical protein